ncbi:GlxA family transcriptional regulator [Streptomyces sp. NRRL B-3648]|uniref:GlxA family transcriptional regulator n=1 Tax=Streptomyces sp. NRRL B-3648 TaxID=1519493 RepID=UPI0006C324E3|nr:AraC family transcriptional regulator [Streptomyces sp. NRRL B-3648]KOV96090.1 AraC family transcriptional regulator [Streptomyces sp. NRRL B-3648]
MSTGTHRVAILVYDGVKLLDVAGPAEVLGEANLLGADYRIALVSTTGADVVSSIGMRVAVDGSAATAPDPDTFLVPGGDVHPRTPVPRDLADAARDLAARAGRVASVCSGAFVLAATGLLDGKRATTHWKIAGELATRYPKARVEPDALYVRDGTTYTSAGVTAGIDLALALVEEDHGPDVSREVARSLVVYLHRAGGQSQFSAPSRGPPPRSPALRRVVDLVTADPAGTYSLAELAGHLNVSTRHLTIGAVGRGPGSSLAPAVAPVQYPWGRRLGSNCWTFLARSDPSTATPYRLRTYRIAAAMHATGS